MTDLWNSTDRLRNEGFSGYKTISELRLEKLRSVPRSPGVYVLLRKSNLPPVFLPKSPAGHFKGKDPTAPLPVLHDNWIDGTSVVYIGKAGGKGYAANLRTRLSAYLRFGAGGRIGHWGGRYIWQLADVEELDVCWRLTTDSDPREMERMLIADFVNRFGKRPFANCCG